MPHLLRKEGLTVTAPGCRLVFAKWKQTGSFFDRVRKGRPTVIPNDVDFFINRTLEVNNEVTAKTLQRSIFRNYKLNLSITTLKNRRKRLGLVAANAKYCQTVRDPNKVKRMTFCNRSLDAHDKFLDVEFTDESTIQLENNKKQVFMRKGERLMTLKSQAKHPAKVHVWAGISHRGATGICIFDGKVRMESKLFCRIIKEFYLPFAAERYDGNCRLQMDNDPKHRSNFTTKFLQENHVRQLEWPPESPDLNLIELVWHQLKVYLRDTAKPTTTAELVDGIKRFWGLYMTRDLCRKYIDHVQTVIPLVLANSGTPTLK